jgi:methionyl aminopeptidase
MHEEPQIPNFGRARARRPKIKPGMTLAIEPMVNLGGHRTKTLADGWTVVTTDGSPSAHFEHTVLTTDSGPEILTMPACRLKFSLFQSFLLTYNSQPNSICLVSSA